MKRFLLLIVAIATMSFSSIVLAKVIFQPTQAMQTLFQKSLQESTVQQAIVRYFQKNKAPISNEDLNTLIKLQVSVIKSDDTKTTTKDNSVLKQPATFDFDGFRWTILNVYKLSKIGSSSNLQYPKNGKFLVIEAEVKNISEKSKYYGSSLLTSGEDQYSEDSTVSVYGSYFFNYDANDSTKFEPGSKLKTFFGFDVKDSKDPYTLILNGWFADKPMKVDLKNVISK